MEKKVPGWVIGIGMAGIIMSCLGIYTGGVTVILPKILQMQGQMMPEMMEHMTKIFPGDAGHGGRSGPFAPGSVKELYGSMFEKLAGSAPWFKTWCYISGGTLLAIAGFYLFASIMLLQLKKYGVILFYIAIAASCAYSFINAAVFFSAGSMIGIMLVFVSIAAGIVNGVLLLTVIFSDKKAFMM
jgi:hypothetical protein